MAEPVKQTRSYESPRRAEQAAATRAAVLDAARRLFLRDGYAAATMAAIAAEARVALKTVYLAFGTKAGLLREVWNTGLRGDDGDAPVAARAWYREVLDEPDPARQLELNARNSRHGKDRIGALAEVIRTAAPLDADIAALWDRIGVEYHANQLAIAESLAAKGALRDGLDAPRAADLLWTINHPHTWHLLVAERGWTPDEYERWAADASRTQLLGS